jgi:hypothetical protein
LAAVTAAALIPPFPIHYLTRVPPPEARFGGDAVRAFA